MDATTSFSHRIEFPFTIQEELGNSTSVFISFLEPQNITAELFDGSGKPCVAECPVTATDLSISVNLPTTAATESWKLVLRARGSQASNVTVAVLSTQRDPLKAPIRAETCVKHDPVTNQALIYTRVTKDGYAVLNAKAVATVDFNGTTGRVFLPLYDHGKASEPSGVSTLKGHSDFAEHSAVGPGGLLLSELKSDMEGDETCKASSSSEECRSASDVESESRRGLPGALIYQGPTGDSEIGLVSFGGVFQVKENVTKEDLPPAPVRDLKVLGVKKKDGKLSVKLSWTCMGAYLDSENATLTDLRASLNTRELIYRFDNATPILGAHILEGSLTPLSPYKVQTVRIQLPQDLVSTSGGKQGSIRLGMRTQNERGVFSPVSNIVPVVRSTRPKPSPVTSTTATNKPHSIASKKPPAGNRAFSFCRGTPKRAISRVPPALKDPTVHTDLRCSTTSSLRTRASQLGHEVV
ncbi:hypothetical protein HPB47_007623 [Ixodes persulcatus]|uniref:Uncharacterized protein n=1 Tax=Ixodes persulcatus TaxID=34615 RepID=A0AC60P7A2_IXOPE|nr:hypothetical protein HPB47_007623 [Ixodes persulcatus]